MQQWTIGNRIRHSVDLSLDDRTVSGLHAKLTRTDDGRWILEDSKSKNGTLRFVDGRWVPIQQAYVGPDERLRFGKTETTVRRLLANSNDNAARKPSGGITWRHDLASALVDLRSWSELKKCLLFVPDLIIFPSQQIMRCAFRRKPVNPFTFMIIGGLIYTMVTTSGLTIQALRNQSQLEAAIVIGIMSFIGPLVLTLLSYKTSFWVFRRFSPRERVFDDFARLSAVLSGLGWMLAGFLALAGNQIGVEGFARSGPAAQQLLLLSLLILPYLFFFNTIGYKHFWKMTYLRAGACQVLSGLLTIAVLFPLVFLIFFVGALVKH